MQAASLCTDFLRPFSRAQFAHEISPRSACQPIDPPSLLRAHNTSNYPTATTPGPSNTDDCPGGGRVNEAHHPWGAARTLLAVALLGYAWRLQDLFPVVAPLKPLTLVTGAFLIVLLLDRRLPTEFGTVARRSPAVFGVILVALALAGVPFSLYPGMSLRYRAQGCGAGRRSDDRDRRRH